MSSSGGGVVSSTSYQQLLRVSSNYVEVGSGELGRGVIKLLYSLEPKKVKEFLEGIVSKGTGERTITWTSGLPSSPYLAWFCILQLDELGGAGDLMDSPKCQELEFLIVMFSVFCGDFQFPDITSSTLREIREYRRSILASKNLEYDDNIARHLKNAFMLFPLLGHAIYKHFSNDMAVTNKTIQSVISDIILDFLDKQQYDEVYYFLQLLHPLKREDAKWALHQLFNSLLQREQKPKELTNKDTENSKNLYTHRVIGALLASDNGPILLDMYNSLHSEQYTLQRKQRNQDESKMTPVYQDLTSLVSNTPLFWHHFYNFVQANQIHFAEYIILRCLDLLQQHQYIAAVDLLKPFQQLTPLIILLAWDKYKDDLAVHKEILAPLWEYQSRVRVDSALTHMCENLLYQIQLSWWCLHFAKRPESNDESVVLRGIFKSLETHSILYTIQSSMLGINVDDLCSILQRNPDTSVQTLEERSTLLAIIKGFYVLHRVIGFLYQSEHVSDTDQLIEVTKYVTAYLSSIEPPKLKYQLLECLYALLFLKENDLLNQQLSRNTFVVRESGVIRHMASTIRALLPPVEEASQISRLCGLINDMTWKLDIIDSLHYFKSSSISSGLLNLLLCSPSTLFTMGLRTENFDVCKTLLQTNRVADSYEQLLASAEIVASIKADEAHFPRDQGIGFYIFADTAMTASSVPPDFHEIKRLLKESQLDPSATKAYTTFLNRMASHPKFELCSLRELLVAVDPLPAESDEFTSTDRPNQQDTILEAYNALNSTQPDILAPKLKEIVKSLERRGSNLMYSQYQYLYSFLSHIVLLGDSLLQERARQDYISLLKKGPKDILKELVFVDKHYKRAEDLAVSLNIDLIGVILSNDTFARGHEAVPSTLDLASLVGSPKSNSSPMEAVSNLLHNSVISMQVINYISKHSPAIASLACFLRSSLSQLHGESVSFAISNSKEYPSLHNWIRTKGAAYAHFKSLILHNRMTESKRDVDDIPEENGTANYSDVTEAVSSEQEGLLQLLGNESVLAEQDFYLQILKKLVMSGELEQALDFLTSSSVTAVLHSLPGENSQVDTYSRLLVEKMESRANIWKHIIRIRNKEAAASIVIRCIERWSIDVCLDLLYMCKSHLQQDSALYQQIEVLYNQMEVYQKILLLDHTWTQWQAVAEVCKSDPTKVVKLLLDSHQHDLARRVSALFNVSNMDIEIEKSYLIDLFRDKDIDKALRVISNLKDPYAVVYGLLEKVDGDNTIKLALVTYLLDNTNITDKSVVDSLSTKALSLQILTRLPVDQQLQFSKLIDFPRLIVESLLLSERITELSAVLVAVPELQDNDLIIFYAKRAMSLISKGSLTFSRGRRNSNARASDEHTDPKMLVQEKPFEFVLAQDNPKLTRSILLTGDPVADNLTRDEHRYQGAPSINLTKSLLELCTDHHKAGETCVNLCYLLSQLLVSDPSKESGSKADNLLIINMIQELLLYAKLQFLNSDSTERANLCDTFLSHVELLQSLLISQSLPAGFSVRDFSDPQKARQLRDKLISEDRMKLALNVATKCNIESDPVWAAWGMSLLKLGRYSEAKEKFNYCLTTPSDKTHSESTNSILNDIIEVLESPPPADQTSLRDLYNMLVASQKVASNKAAFNDEMSIESYLNALHVAKPDTSAKRVLEDQRANISSLDSVRLMQCIYYLSKYGSSKSLVRFWVKHNLLEDACRYIFSNQQSVSLFIEEIVHHCLSHSTLSTLQKALKRIDPTFQSSRSYMDAACKYFNEKKAFKLLLEFLVFMGDNVRAGLTYIKLFLEEADPNVQLKYLENAKNHFLDGLTNLQSGEAVLSETEITRYMKTVTLQIQVSKYFQQTKGAPMPASQLSLFGTAAQRSALAEHLLVVHNFDLAFQIVQDFRLPTKQIYINSIAKMKTSNKVQQKILDMLRSIKGAVTEEEWDEVVLATINMFAVDLQDPKTAEKFISKVVSIPNQVQAHIMCGKLRGAYLLAVKNQLKSHVELIRKEAKRIEDKSTEELCDRFLQENIK